MPWINSICKEFLFGIICGVQNVVCGIIMQGKRIYMQRENLGQTLGFLSPMKNAYILAVVI